MYFAQIDIISSVAAHWNLKKRQLAADTHCYVNCKDLKWWWLSIVVISKAATTCLTALASGLGHDT